MTMFNDTLTSMIAGLTPARSKAQSVTFSGRVISQVEIDNAVRFSSLARRIIHMPAEDMTRKWREWQGEADQISKIEQAETKFGVLGKVRKTLARANQRGDAYIFIDNGEDPIKPLVPETARPLRSVSAVQPGVIEQGDIDQDIMSEFYDSPANYDILSTNGLIRVHPSRIVHFIGAARDEYSYACSNDSTLTAMMDDLKNHDSSMANLADMMFEAKVDVMKVKDLMLRVSDPVTEAAMQARYQLAATMKSVNGMMVIDMADEDYQQKQISFATLPDVIDRFQIAVSGAARIPRALLFGVSAGGMGSTGDLELSAYYDMINARQSNDMQPRMSYLDKMLIKTALGTLPPELHYNWRSLWQMSDKEKAEIGKMIVEKYKMAVDAGIFSAEFSTEPLINELTEAGVSPGLESAFNEFTGEMQERDLVSNEIEEQDDQEDDTVEGSDQ